MTKSPSKKILVADDEEDVLALVTSSLKSAGYSTLNADDGPSALASARSHIPALIVLDLMLPGMSGLEVCKALKSDSATKHIPIVMLTAKADEVDRILGFELGADDYMTKPFSPRELTLRVQSVLRRTNAPVEPADILKLGEISVDRVRHQVSLRGKEIELTATDRKSVV